jgi:hypothetical protein
VARMFCDILQPDGSPFPGDPRYILKRTLAKAAEKGYTYYLGPELEYFYFKSSTSPEILDKAATLTPRPWTWPTTGAPDHLRHGKMGIRVEYSHHEVAASQHEIDMRYDEGLKMADKTMTMKVTVKAIAMLNGVYATFMPKPIFGINGSGMHTHQSLFKDGKNAFYDPWISIISPPPWQKLHRRAPETRPGDHRHLQPVGELLQTPGAGLRSPGVRGLGPPQPLRLSAGAHVQTRQGGGHPLRIPGPGPRPATPTWPLP